MFSFANASSVFATRAHLLYNIIWDGEKRSSGYFVRSENCKMHAMCGRLKSITGFITF